MNAIESSTISKTQTAAEKQKGQWNKFIERLNILKSQHKPLLDCIVTQNILYQVRVKTDRQLKDIDVISNLIQILYAIRGLSYKGVKLFTIEIDRFSGKITKTEMEQFLDCLSSLQDLYKIQVIELQRTNVNAYTFLLFFLYEPKNCQQQFIYFNTSMGRKSTIEIEVQNSKVIQKIQFLKYLQQDESKSVKEIKMLNIQLLKIMRDEWQCVLVEQEICKERTVKIMIEVKESPLRELIGCTFNLLEMMSLLQQITRIELELTDQSNQKGNQIQFDPRQLEDLNILHKMVFTFSLLQIYDFELLVVLLRHSRGIALLNNNFIAEALNIQELNQLVQRDMEEENQKYYQNLKEIQIIDIERFNQEQPQLKFISLFRNIESASLSFIEILGSRLLELNQKYIISCLNNCKQFSLCSNLSLKKDTIFIALPQYRFSVKCVEEILGELHRPFHLSIMAQNLSEHIDGTFSSMISRLAFNNQVLSIKFQGNSDLKYLDYIELIKIIKLFNLYLVSYDKLISPHMSYNPKHVILDLFYLE